MVLSSASFSYWLCNSLFPRAWPACTPEPTILDFYIHFPLATILYYIVLCCIASTLRLLQPLRDLYNHYNHYDHRNNNATRTRMRMRMTTTTTTTTTMMMMMIVYAARKKSIPIITNTAYNCEAGALQNSEVKVTVIITTNMI